MNNEERMKIIKDTGMLQLIKGRLHFQLYSPILTFRKDKLALSFSTVLVISKNTWSHDGAFGFQVLGFGFGVGKLKKESA